ncbi:MarR family winged helix-turn-helix transcriptional regulator [Streptomyces sp. ISID311]|uniref:MarR family winged helix-turn-helix transcriptional regulator n=1 Tax=Streptomyces sp. ISID311 TaxID=2601673 RepID=UPI0011BD3D7D|nr:MarR family winged helix-turn-helix transcriptional regulator [Streptomyces sp. ISID311]TXC97381.1 winged helix-turn-helix transcriptional regulator [Streptomyces sp. ISID311]
MTDQTPAPLGALALQLLRLFESELFTAMQQAGYPDLRLRHSSVLTAIDPAGTRLTVLAARAGMTPQSMGELVDDLESSGYLTRVNDPTDRRARLIIFTDRGQVAMRACREIAVAIDRRYATLVGPHEYDAARTTLIALRDKLTAEPAE